LILGIVFSIAVLTFLIYELIHWGSLAWRYPAKLKEKAIEMSVRVYGSDAYVWIIRIFTLIYGLVLLLLVLILVLYLLGLFPTN
jgi:hypothetical protein